MKATPSACACIVAALETLTFPPRTCWTNSVVSSCVNRSSLRRRTMPIRSMSAMSVTASCDLGQLLGTRCEPEEDGQVGVGADDVAEHPHAVLVGPLEIVDEYRYGAGCRPARGWRRRRDRIREGACDPARGRRASDRLGPRWRRALAGTALVRRCCRSPARPMRRRCRGRGETGRGSPRRRSPRAA